MIKVYSKPNCRACLMTKKLLKDKGVQFQEFDVTADIRYMNEAKATGFTTMPITVTENEVIAGFIPHKLRELA